MIVNNFLFLSILLISVDLLLLLVCYIYKHGQNKYLSSITKIKSNKMMRLLFKSAGKNIPIIYVDADIDLMRTTILLKKLRSTKYELSQGMAIVCSIQNAMPVQVDKIFQQVKRIKQQYKIPIYGFVLDECTPQSYYMLSIADEIYSLPSTVFKLKRNHYRLDWNNFYKDYGFQKFVIKSTENLSGNYMDKFSSSNQIHTRNRKQTDISLIMYEESKKLRLSNLQNRQLNQERSKILTLKTPPQQVPIPMIGQDAIKAGLIDGIGQHFEFIKQKYPECHIQIIKYKEDPIQVRKAFAILTSPFLLMLFLFKVMLKWGLIMYFWVKSKAKQAADSLAFSDQNENKTQGSFNEQKKVHSIV